VRWDASIERSIGDGARNLYATATNMLRKTQTPKFLEKLHDSKQTSALNIERMGVPSVHAITEDSDGTFLSHDEALLRYVSRPLLAPGLFSMKSDTARMMI
jgi:hypothetical protein